MDLPTLKIILPVGLSFYSFMAIAYMVDVHRKSVEPVRSPLLFFSSMSFFPQLLAGPIGRMPNLLPQFEKVRFFDYAMAVDGCRQMLWGYFKKLVIADGCAKLTDSIYASMSQVSGSVLLLGAFMYAIQIYADFSGYSDMAVGCGKLFGIRLQVNFRYPYFASNISDFWRRWHISLTTWFRDYFYIPMGGSRCSRWKQFRNTFIVFTLSGLWHGANWTFVMWGILHAILFLPMIFFRKIVNKVESFWVGKLALGVTTFISVMLCWIFFRSADFTMACNYLSGLFSASVFTIPKSHLSMLPLIFVSIIVEWFGRSREYALDIATWPKLLRWIVYFLVAVACVAYKQRVAEFIYFQF
jgi:D-alanyl-lipoteichoic acid acyltransferase DltB (MBOAT superfamily)